MTEPSAGRYRDALRNRDFRVMLTAFLIDQIGSWAYNVVLIVYVYDRTGSTTWIAATTAAGWIPRILFCSYAGVLADRFERTRTLSRVIGIMETTALAAALVASFAVAALIRGVGLTDAPLTVGLGFPVIAAAGLRPLIRAESRTVRAAGPFPAFAPS